MNSMSLLSELPRLPLKEVEEEEEEEEERRKKEEEK